MKKIIVYILFFTLPFWAYSQKVNESTARKVAEKVLMMDKPDLKYQMTEKAIPIGLDNDTLYFVFTYPDDGYAIVSAESSASPVLGHCKKGKYEPENMPPGLLFLLDKYKYSISRLRKDEAKQTKSIKEQWDNYLNSDNLNLKSYTVGENMLETTWGQRGGYNQFCPPDSPAGCTAVAMAQILRYWQCKTIPTGTVQYSGIGWQGGFANFGATTYNWIDMDDANADDDNALLIYHAGVSCLTHYKTDVSTSTPWKARDGFVNNWGLSSSADVKWRISHLSNWQEMLEDELDLERPILYSGGNLFGGGHSWVIQGYESNGAFRCNWGWYGDHDGPYFLGDFDPEGDPGPYNQYESAIFNVFPEQQRVTGPSIVCTSNSTFTLNNAPAGAVVTWAVNTSGVTPNSGTGTTATFHSTCPTNRRAEVTFTIFHPCDTMQFKKTFGSGGPDPSDISLTILDNLTGQEVDSKFMCPNTMYNLYFENSSSCNTSNYTWTLPYGMSLISTSQDWALINTNSSYGGIMMVHGQTCCTGCGSNVLLFTDVLATGGYSCGGYYYSYAPNPVIDELTVSAISTADEDKKVVDSSIKIAFEIKIYDSNKVMVRSAKSKDNEIVVNTSGLKKGTYFLHIIEREQVLRKEQILVN